MKPVVNLSFNFITNQDEVYYSFHIASKNLYSRLTVTSSGLLQRFAWIPETQQWNQFWYAPKDQCDSYRECGAYGICDSNASPVCKSSDIGDGGSAETIIIVIAVGVGMILALTGFSIWKRKRLLSACNGKTQQKGPQERSQDLLLNEPKTPGYCLGRNPFETDSSSSKQDESFTVNQVTVTVLDASLCIGASPFDNYCGISMYNL
ncbi:hypothetical protein DKX38_005452 [Salix brachista]|uniref:S-locus glycoprotein domain-containing protein n=1 Tax=Salix brachista TaxID=2182728 RepID=A0A5N5MZJ9_9ROSI|nr:hypothetical protein DKX38_005452 [Salix brachista]